MCPSLVITVSLTKETDQALLFVLDALREEVV